MAGAGKIEVKLIGDSSSLQRAFAQSGKAAAGLGTSLGKLAKTAAISFGAFEAGKAIKSTVGAAIDFEKQMRNVNSIARLGEKDFDALGKSVTGMAQEVGQKPKVLAAGLYDIVSSGFKAADATKVLKVSAIAATAGMTDTATSAKAVTAALNAYHEPADKARQVSDVLFQTVNKGVLTFEELSQQMGDLVPASAPLGISLEEVGAGMATLTLEGVPAAEAATRMKNAMLDLGAKATPALKGLFKEAGYGSANAAIKALGFTGVLQLLQKETHGNVAATAKLTPEIRALLGVVGLTGKNLKVYQANLRAMTDAQKGAGLTAKVYAEQSKSVATAWQKVSAGIDVLKIQIGSALLPALASGVGALSGFIGALTKADGFKAKIAVVFDTAEKIGDKLGKTLAAVDWAGVWDQAKGLGSGLADAIEGIDWSAVGQTIGDSISASVSVALSGTKGLPTKILEVVDSIDWNAMGRAMGPGLAAAVLSAFVAMTDIGFWVKNWDAVLAIALVAFGGAPLAKLKLKLAVMFAKIGEDAALAVAEAFGRFSPRLGLAVQKALSQLPGLVSAGLGKLVGIVSGVFSRLGRLAVFTLKVLGVRAVIDAVAGLVSDVIAWIKSITPGWLKGGLEAVAGLLTGLTMGFVRVQLWLIGMFAKIIGFFAGASGWLYSAGADIIQGLWNGALSKWHAFEGWLSGLPGKIAGAFKGTTHAGSFMGMPQPASAGGGGDFHRRRALRAVDSASDREGGFRRGAASAQGYADGLKSKTAEVLGQVNKLQSALDAINARREKEDRASAVRDAQSALIEAQGMSTKTVAEQNKRAAAITAAERQLARAREDIRVAAMTKELTAGQAHYDKVQAQFQKAQDAMKAAQQKALDAMQKALEKARTRASTAYSRLSDLIQRGFDAQNDAWVSPAQAALNAITDRRAQEDLRAAVQDAQQQLSDALAGDDPGAVADAQRALNRAKEDIVVAGLQEQAAAQQTAHDKAMAAMQDRFAQEVAETGGNIQKIVDVINTFDGGFGAAGKNLGEAFVRELRKAMSAAAVATGAVAAAKGVGLGGSFATPFLSGASPLVAAPAAGGVTFAPGSIVVQGWMGNDQALAARLVDTIHNQQRVGRLRLST